MVGLSLYVEGGGNKNKALKTECHQAFTTFITKAGLKKRPRIVVCGGRQNAYESFRTAINNNQAALLLVDSEEAVSATHQNGDDSKTWNPWGHLKAREGDRWTKPHNAADTDCHLMVQTMEHWLLADRDALAEFYGQNFKTNQLPPPTNPIENILKADAYAALRAATQDTQKGAYGKGSHSFKILTTIDPEKVIAASPWAARLMARLKHP